MKIIWHINIFIAKIDNTIIGEYRNGLIFSFRYHPGGTVPIITRSAVCNKYDLGNQYSKKPRLLTRHMNILTIHQVNRMGSSSYEANEH